MYFLAFQLTISCLIVCVFFVCLFTCRVTPKSDLTETHPLQDSSSQLPEVSQPGSAQDALSLPANSVSDTRKDKDFADSSNP